MVSIVIVNCNIKHAEKKRLKNILKNKIALQLEQNYKFEFHFSNGMHNSLTVLNYFKKNLSKFLKIIEQ